MSFLYWIQSHWCFKEDKETTCIYHVKITGLNTTHKCELSTQCYRHAQSSSRGTEKISLREMDSILQILKVNPTAPASILRPLLVQVVNNDTAVDATFIRNFRIRAMYYHLKYPNKNNLNVDITLDNANLLLSSRDVSPIEHAILDNPLVRLNFLRNDVRNHQRR